MSNDFSGLHDLLTKKLALTNVKTKQHVISSHEAQ